MNLLLPRTIPTWLRVSMGVSVLLLCAAFSVRLALPMIERGHAGMAAALGVLAGLYGIVLSRSEFVRWAERRGVWPALLIAYGLRTLIGVLALLAPQISAFRWAAWVDVAIVAWSARILSGVKLSDWTPTAGVFGLTVVDGVLQHALLAAMFGMAWLIIRPYCAITPVAPRTFEPMLKPGQV